MAVEPSDEKIALIEKIFCSDIIWAIKHGPGWDPNYGAEKNGKWHKVDSTLCKGVCAVGAYCVRHQPDGRKGIPDNDVVTTAMALGVDAYWLGMLYRFIAEPMRSHNYPEAAKLALFLRTFADEKDEEWSHELAQRAQARRERRWN